MQYMGRDRTTTIVGKYDQQVLVPILVKVSKYLNHGHEESPPPFAPNNDDFLWGIIVSTKEVGVFLVKIRLSMYSHITMCNDGVKSLVQMVERPCKSISWCFIRCSSFLGDSKISNWNWNSFSIVNILTSLW